MQRPSARPSALGWLRERSSNLVLVGVGLVLVGAWPWLRGQDNTRAALLGAGGVVLVGYFGALLLQTRRLQQQGVRVQGTVVEVRRRTSTDEYGSSVTVRPVVRFTTLHGRTVEFLSRIPPTTAPVVGRPVAVRYHADSPERAEVESHAAGRTPMVGALIGVVLLVMAVVVYVRA